ncbi:MAG TPA: F0F1 ATP synthase subunit epsilon [Humibacter sp.]|jgi:F-type H+-transporting ATPase subunit epsilon|uniref:F0F1 ATP synthase subunit epsilon n=1 Tax=Humibacter sp. RRB41 TaxID=2919946 RepID=UPI001FAA2F88|nr:F0F1 ATP synthase subunit epsilon [Humibacter sp. RRB41]HWD60855.1 F0F1 ATP synthase subunit epsilon [Humibacter sp.]
MATLKVSVVSADAEVWSGEASMVVARTVIGEIGILPGHTPVLGVLAEGEVRITLPGGERLIANAADGFVSFENNELTVLAGKAQLV